jgi:hypothetical protein
MNLLILLLMACWRLLCFWKRRGVYLCGPINGRSDDDCKGWREYVKERVPNTVDPMARDYRGRELEPGIAAEIVEKDKWLDILWSNALIVYYDKPSVGTTMEVFLAWLLGIRILLVDKSGKPLSPWLIYHAKEIYTTLDEAIAAL